MVQVISGKKEHRLIHLTGELGRVPATCAFSEFGIDVNERTHGFEAPRWVPATLRIVSSLLPFHPSGALANDCIAYHSRLASSGCLRGRECLRHVSIGGHPAGVTGATLSTGLEPCVPRDMPKVTKESRYWQVVQCVDDIPLGLAKRCRRRRMQRSAELRSCD